MRIFGDLQRERSIQVNPRRPASAFSCRSITAFPACASLATNEPQSYIFGGGNHPLHSNSQKRILESYAKQNGFTNLKWYTDDGFSGANFQRSGFQSMLADIEAGLVGTVIVKDMSRLGRNYLQVGMYTEMIFPQKNVRFIAINDDVDSAQGENDFAPLRNIFNEWLVRDTSKKSLRHIIPPVGESQDDGFILLHVLHMVQKLRPLPLVLLLRRLVYQRVMVKRIFLHRLNAEQVAAYCLLDDFRHILGIPQLLIVFLPVGPRLHSHTADFQRCSCPAW